MTFPKQTARSRVLVSNGMASVALRTKYASLIARKSRPTFAKGNGVVEGDHPLSDVTAHTWDYGDCLLISRCRYSLNILDPDTPARLQVLARLLDAVQKPRILFKLIVEPVILGRESD
jgi:hypothetical protein